MFVVPQLEAFYPDLSDPEFQSAIAVVHRATPQILSPRPLAQPFRYIAHNGETTRPGKYKQDDARNPL